MDNNGTCKISDFGLSTIVTGTVQEVHETDGISGTPVYTAPEVANYKFNLTSKDLDSVCRC